MVNTLKVRRAERGVNQTVVAKALRMGRDRYLRIELDYTDPTPAEQIAIAAYFGVAHEIVFPGSPAPDADGSTVASEGAHA